MFRVSLEKLLFIQLFILQLLIAHRRANILYVKYKLKGLIMHLEGHPYQSINSLLKPINFHKVC